MATYVIGDIQGCFAACEKLLKQIQFDGQQDVLWFTGDLVNRGPQSLETLRFVKSLGHPHQTVLGNHDLHLLALAYGVKQAGRDDTLQAILSAPDCGELVAWLRHRPLLLQDKGTGYVMVHAGLAPAWPTAQAKKLALEVETCLQGAEPHRFLEQMYGNLPDAWDDRLTGMDRLRCITNYFTRMRFCHPDGRLDLLYKGDMAHKPANLIPWFEVTPRLNGDAVILFGHWAALGGQVTRPNLYALDTGCVWGNCLTAMRLDDKQCFQVSCQ